MQRRRQRQTEKKGDRERKIRRVTRKEREGDRDRDLYIKKFETESERELVSETDRK